MVSRKVTAPFPPGTTRVRSLFRANSNVCLIVFWSIFTAALIAYGAVLVRNASYAAGGTDSSGYLNEARSFASGELIGAIPIVDQLRLGREYARLFTPLGLAEGREHGTMVPSYPPGLPLHMTLFALVGGWERGPFLVAPFASVVAVLLIYFLARQVGLSLVPALSASVMLAMCPTFIFSGLQPMSDVLATTYALLAVLAALVANRDARWALLAGAAFGVGVMVRPTNLLMAIPLAIALGLRFRKVLFAGLGALPFAIATLVINRMTFGSPFTTGYGSVSGMLEWANFQVRSWHYVYWLVALMTLLVMPGGLLVALVPEVTRRIRFLLVGWFVPFYLFYSLYWAYDTWWYTRFLLPAIPSLLLGALLVLEAIERRAVRKWFGVIPALAAIVVALTGMRQIKKERVLDTGRGEHVYVEAADLVKRHVPERAIVVAMQHSGSLLYYCNRLSLRYDLVKPDEFALLQAHAFNERYRWYALVADFEREELLKKTSGEWRPIARARHVTLLTLN